MGTLLAFVLLAAVFSSGAHAQDPIKDFCRLWGHQTAVVDRQLYIDGGFVNWDPVADNYTSTWLRYANLDDDNNGFPQEHANLTKNTSPFLNGAVLWPDQANKILYLFGGEYSNSPPSQFTLWYYDIIYNTWNTSDAGNKLSVSIQRPSWGAGVAVENIAKGFYYGGWLSNASVPNWNTDRTAVSKMMVYDMLKDSFQDVDGPDDTVRAEGAMLYIPWGDSGFLVYFGGVQTPYHNATAIGVPMSNIFLYDMANDKWYNQTATGDVPEMRRRFCAGATWAQDRTSYNIYLFGGASITQGNGFGDVYVLSLPSFTWIKFWPRPEDPSSDITPHHSLTCNVIDGSQMIVMGGTFPNITKCDTQQFQGMHGLDLGQANTLGAKWATFNPDVTSYQVPSVIAETIGGGPTGGATITTPSGGWVQHDLSVVATKKPASWTRAPTRHIPSSSTGLTATLSSPSSSSSSSPAKKVNKALIGGAVGGAIAGLLVIAFVISFLFFYLRARKRRRASPPGVRATSDQTAEVSTPNLFTAPKQASNYHPNSPFEMSATPQPLPGLPSNPLAPASPDQQRSLQTTSPRGYRPFPPNSAVPTYAQPPVSPQPYYPPPRA